VKLSASKFFPPIAALLLFHSTGCVRSLTPSPEAALRLSEMPELSAEVQPDTLKEALAREIQHFESGQGPKQLRFGKRLVSRAEYLRSLKKAYAAVSESSDPKRFRAALERSFDVYEAYGNPDWGDVFVTGYYEATIDGSLTPTAELSQPLYAKPPELIPGKLYYSREEIDSGGLLRGRGLELCYVDPIDATVIQTQGSGAVRLPDGTVIRLVYAAKNGQPYKPIGKVLKDVLPPDQMTLDGIESYLRKQPPAKLRSILNQNPSYVFFEKHSDGARTALGVRATPGRTIAVDRRIYPQGALAFLEFEHPAPKKGKGGKISRLVLAQDTGTAIKGPGRVDFFWGKGDEAKLFAGRTKAKGRLYFLAPKSAADG